MKHTFSGKNVILTGAASGIGRALATSLARSGANVFALDLDGRGLESLAAECGVGSIHPFALDVSDFDAYARVVEEIGSRCGTIDYLFNNAGVTQLGEAHLVPFDRWKWLLDINLMGVAHGIHLVYPIMIGQGRGHIVNTASIAGETGYATAAAYTASKAAVLELSRSLGAEAKGHGVKVSAACPGYVDSGIFSQDRILGVDRERVINDLPVKMMTPRQAAEGLLKGVAAGKRVIVFPLSARLFWALSKWAPGALGFYQRKLLDVFRKNGAA